jgi:pyridoxine 4-dehydrogenase
MATPNAAAAGSFTIGGDLTVNRLGFGAMRITGPGIWGPPTDRDEALRVLRRLPELGVNFIDTAESYGPNVSEELIREALHPYDGIVVATKAGFQRSGPDRWTVDGRPEVLRRGVEGSLKRLGVDRIDLWQLHRIDSRVPRKEQFDVIREFRKEGLVRHVGLSEVSVEDIREAQHYFQVVTVQNRYNPTDRDTSDPVLKYCASHTIGFLPWAPLGAGSLARSKSTLAIFTTNHPGATTSQIALAWSLRKSPVVIAIPGTSSVSHLEENVAAAELTLLEKEYSQIEDIR